MVLILSQPELCEDVFQGMLQGILEERKAERPCKPHGSEWKRIKILACRNCRSPFSTTLTHLIEEVNRLDGKPYPNFYHVKEGANLEIQRPRSFHTAHLSNGKSILLLRVLCSSCRVLTGFQVLYLDENNGRDRGDLGRDRGRDRGDRGRDRGDRGRDRGDRGRGRGRDRGDRGRDRGNRGRDQGDRGRGLNLDVGHYILDAILFDSIP